jgi:hypothetical protein
MVQRYVHSSYGNRVSSIQIWIHNVIESRSNVIRIRIHNRTFDDKFFGTHNILNASRVHKIQGSFCVILKEFGLKLILNELVFEKFS